MPYSMTGFAFAEETFGDLDVSIKIKSVNNKGIDISVKAPRDILFFIEPDVRSLIKESLARGSIQTFIDIKKKSIELSFSVEILKKAVEEVKKQTRYAGLNLSDDRVYEVAVEIASNFEEEEKIDNETKEKILGVLKLAIDKLKEERKKEGEKLVLDIKQRLDRIENLVNKIEAEKEQIISKAQEKITEKLEQLLGENYSERAFIEATILADKMDITEEIVRLKSHIKRFNELLTKDEPVGRKMDFLCQEMHREINTLGNKMPDFSEYTVEMKTELEKIRQQVQNIE